jgi:hypothetical protein
VAPPADCLAENDRVCRLAGFGPGAAFSGSMTSDLPLRTGVDPVRPVTSVRFAGDTDLSAGGITTARFWRTFSETYSHLSMSVRNRLPNRERKR